MQQLTVTARAGTAAFAGTKKKIPVKKTRLFYDPVYIQSYMTGKAIVDDRKLPP